jgi:hypothetical protein
VLEPRIAVTVHQNEPLLIVSDTPPQLRLLRAPHGTTSFAARHASRIGCRKPGTNPFSRAQFLGRGLLRLNRAAEPILYPDPVNIGWEPRPRLLRAHGRSEAALRWIGILGVFAVLAAASAEAEDADGTACHGLREEAAPEPQACNRCRARCR